MATTRSPTLSRVESATATTSPAASCPITFCGFPARNALYSVHMGAACTLMTAQLLKGSGSGASTNSALRSPVIATFFILLAPYNLFQDLTQRRKDAKERRRQAVDSSRQMDCSSRLCAFA